MVVGDKEEDKSWGSDVEALRSGERSKDGEEKVAGKADDLAKDIVGERDVVDDNEQTNHYKLCQ